MPDLPGGIYTLLLACGVGLALVAFFAVKEFRFSTFRRRGIRLFGEGDYQAALRHLIQAERLWMLRLSKQTMSSRAEDCKNLGTVLALIGEAAEHCSLRIKTAEYRNAAVELEHFFLSRKSSSKHYPQIYSMFVKQRKQFRLETQRLLK